MAQKDSFEESALKITAEIEDRILAESLTRTLGLEVTRAVEASDKLRRLQKLGGVARERLLRPHAKHYLRQVTLELLGIDPLSVLPAENHSANVWAPDLGETHIGLRWSGESYVASVEWEKTVSEQRLQVLGKDDSLTLAEVNRYTVQVSDRNTGSFTSEPYTYWYDPSDPTPMRMYRNQAETAPSRQIREPLETTLAVRLIHNLQHAKPINSDNQ